ncbi:TonB-dependent receptor domain-containing protein [Novosphingobium sp. MMS21-SN21R]|uniref:TonB-dependent receptor plug domain-containing protein n=1 Tax=Novosphingobium sp. MMS21-SN21R TaxID=2969298 RepID=UPI002888AD8A|nr:TonB-dependent receptor [Novosphingobium sp. MMS21-SN21R]MDT0508681.1 TonB-dependent receptor [Novosphingobium sp. MMS21-SN21R]
MNGSSVRGRGVYRVKKFLISVSALAFASPVLAQNADDIVIADLKRPEPITVIATGSETLLSKTGQPITVITAQEIQSIQGPDITRVLERVPGLTITRNGGPGSFTGVRLRGADAEQVLVLVDGVRVEDVSAPSGGFDFGTLTPGGIERIDVLRGSNSVVWGSAALGGVIAVQSRDLNGVEASAEYGAHETWTADAAAGISSDLGALTLNGGYATSDGVSAAAAGTEPDGFRQYRIGGRGRLNVTQELAIVATARYADTRTDIDGYAPPFYTFGDTPEYQTTRQASGRVGLRYTGSALTLNTGFALSDTKRNYYDPTFGTAPSYGYKGRSERADLTGRLNLPASVTLDFGADSEWTRFSSTFDAEAKANLTSGHALLGWTSDRASLAAGLRYDDHSRFGSAWTFGANGSFQLVENLRLRASYGEGFKAPTLYQLLSDYGNAALVPERSKSYDAGLEWGSRNGALHASATVFRRDSRNLIAFVSCASLNACATRPFGLYDNIGKARAEGVEVELGAKPSDTLQLRAAYTYLEARNLTPGNLNNGKDLARRPRHALTVSGDWTSPLAGLTLGADLRMVGDSYDNAANTVPLDGYAVTTLRASFPVTDKVEFYGRVENLFDEGYQTVADYGTWGRSAFIGIRARY